MGLFKFTTSAEDVSVEEADVITAITLVANHVLVTVNASRSGAVKITPPAATSSKGVVYIFKKIDSSGNSVTIDGNGAETIDGEQTIVLNLQYAYVTIACDGDEWHIIGGINVKMEDLLAQQLSKLEEMISVLKNLETHLELGSGEELNKEESE